jgi:hypothetical protein
MSADRQRERLDALKGQLVDGVRSLVESDRWTEYLAMRARFHDYSPRNVWLILCQRPDATRVAGFKTWQSLGRQVRKGEHALWILAPCPHRRVETIETPDGPEDREHAWTTFRAVPVFDVDQTDGDELSQPASRLQGDDAQGLAKLVADLVVERGFSFTFEEISGGTNGRTDFEARTVVVDRGLEPAMRAKTAVHELAHVLLHEDHRDMPRPLKELEAESVAYLVLAGLGIDAAEYSFGYLAGWVQGRTDLVADVVQVGERVSEAADKILSELTS